MSGLARPKCLTVTCIVAAALIAFGVRVDCSPQSRGDSGPGAAPQTASTPGGPGGSSNSAPAAKAEAPQGAGCATIRQPASAGGASIVPDADESVAHKSWQPVGGEIQFTVKSFAAIPADASVFTCFRWKSGGDGQFVEGVSRLELSGDGKMLKVIATVPALGKKPGNVERALPLVPRAEVRILAVDSQNAVRADVIATIGITYPLAAFGLAVVTLILACVVLCLTTSRRLQHAGILKANWFLRVISTPSGFASLSQLQIVLWTLVVAVSAVYVMSLSGELIQITNGTLVLLGIAGAAGIGTKVHTATQGAMAETDATQASAAKAAADIVAAQKAAEAGVATADPVTAARITAESNLAQAEADTKSKLADATRTRADALKNPPASQTPRWSDLIVNERVNDDGTVTREIDVTRFQMLLFTLITATFVLMNVVTTYVIPEISTGFQMLMGISNGVYLGSKIAQGA